MPTVKQLSRIFSQDDSLNRLQDQLASALNPILREIKGDLSGPLESPTVAGLRGRPIANTVPTVGQALVYNGTEWAAGAAGTTFTVSPPLDLSGTPPVLSIPQADATTDGYLSSADWLTFDGKVSSVTATSPLASSGGTTPDISLTGVVAAANGGTGLSTSGATAGYVLTADGSGGWTSSPASGSSIGDPNVVLLMAGTGSAGSTTFPDTSLYQMPLTAAGNTSVVATPSRFGAGSAAFDGNGDYIAGPTSPIYALRTQNFTIEGWLNPTTYGGGGFSIYGGTIVDTQPISSGPLYVTVFVTLSGNIAVYSNGVSILVSSSTIPLNAWSFFAVVRNAGTVTIYINGVASGSASFTSNLLSQDLTIGATVNGRSGTTFLKYNGYMNDIRISTVARYTTNFTPPAAAFPSGITAYGYPVGFAGGVLGYPGSTYPNPSGLAGVADSVGAENTIKIAQAGVGGAAVIRWDPYNNSNLTGNNTGSIVGPRSNATGANAFFFPGGTMLVEGGQGTPFHTGSDGGTAKLLGGRATGAYRSGPAIVQGGASNDGAAGHAYVLGGSGGTNGNPAINAGNVYIQSGSAGLFYGGNIEINAAGGRTLSGYTDVSGGTFTAQPSLPSNGGHVYVRGGDATTTGSGGDAYIRGGTSPSGTKGRVYVGATNTSAVYISSAAPAANVYVQNQQVDLVTALPTSGQFLGYNGTKWLPTTLPAVSPRLGNTLVVDSVNGNDLTGAVNGLPFATPQAAINYINTNSLVGVTVWIMPGTYALSAGITIPNTCSLRGLSTQTTRLTLSASNPGGTVTMLTMGENSRVEDLTLTLTSTNATTNLVGVNTPGNTSTTSKLRTCVVTVDNSTLAHTTTTNVYGIYDNGTGTLGPSSFSFNFTRGVTINVFSNGGGNKRLTLGARCSFVPAPSAAPQRLVATPGQTSSRQRPAPGLSTTAFNLGRALILSTRPLAASRLPPTLRQPPLSTDLRQT